MSIDHGNCGTNCKLPDVIENGKEDLISNLPDEIISSILSCVVDTKEVVRTCVLSKHWKYKWTSSLHNIYIKDYNDDFQLADKAKTATLVKFVNRILDLTDFSKIKSFSLLSIRKYDSHHLNTWIDTVVRRKVEMLTIGNTSSNQGIVFPQCSLDSSYETLRELEFWSHGTLKLPHEKCFSKLKILVIGCEVVQVENVRSSGQLLLDFPVLQVLKTWDCKWLNVTFVEIRAPALVKFHTWSKADPVLTNYVVKISAANLVKFKSSGSVPLKHFVLNSPSLHYAVLKNCLRYKNLGRQAMTILKSVPGLKHLKVSGEIVEALLTQEKLGMLLLSNSIWLKHLDLCSSYDTKRLLELLEMMPSLDSLSLDLVGWRVEDCGQLESLQRCRLFSSLKEVKLIYFVGGYLPAHVQLVKFILKNANELKKLLVFTTAGTRHAEMIMKQDLSRLPKSSSYVSIVVEGMSM